MSPLWKIGKLLTNWAFLRWLSIYVYCKKVRRYKEKKIKYFDNIFYIADCASFVWQLKEIFVDQSYQFESRNQKPLIIDCGANMGISAVYFAKAYPAARVIAFEADPNIFRFLLKNLEANNIANVEPINKAVWTHENGIVFGSEGADAGSIFFPHNVVKVPSVRLRDYLTETIDMLKLDIEGAEEQVLIDCQDKLNTVQNCFIEFHSVKDREQKLDKILHILSTNGFRYYIQSVHTRENPLCQLDQEGIFDLQLNIFATRPQPG